MKIPMRAATAALVAGACLAACEDEPPDPHLEGGAGIRFTFPAGTDTLDGVRVELWHRNQVLPPGCNPSLPVAGAVFVPAAASSETDSCTRMSIRIWNLIGETVRTVPDTPFVDRLAWGWDQLDDEGLPVPSGYYPVFSRCLDSQGSFTFSGHYDVLAAREEGSCQWPLWIEELDPLGSRTRAFGPFPNVLGTVLRDEQGNWLELVSFLNPFLVQARAEGMETFEAEVVLVKGSYTEVAVVWTAAGGIQAP